ncbi:MAG: M50 family metallopeptidase [Verrucomicrobiia bacterium]
MIRFRLLGFPVEIQPWFWLTCALLGGGLWARTGEEWIGVACWAIVALISILMHELGHALAGQHYGARPAIALHALGGVTVLPGASFTRFQNIAVSAAGPAAGLMLAAACALLLFNLPPELPVLARRLLSLGLVLNLFWTAFNLLPIQPMDGGQILRDLLGPRHFRLTCIIGAVIGAALTFWAIQAGQWFLAIFAAILAWGNFQGSVQFPGGTLSR